MQECLQSVDCEKCCLEPILNCLTANPPSYVFHVLICHDILLQGFLHIDEYPPDANQGFDIPSAVVSFPDFQASVNFLEDASSNKSPLLVKMQV